MPSIAERLPAWTAREAVPFAAKSAAEAFVKANGGRVVDYVEAKRSVAADTPPASAGET